MQTRQRSLRWAVTTAAAITFALRAGEGESILRHQPGGGPPVKVHGDTARIEKMKVNPVQLGDLPAAAQEALRQHANGATIERIIKPPIFYVVTLTLEGEPRAFWVSEDATHCEGPGPLKTAELQAVSTPRQWTDLPQAVQNLVSSRFEGAPLLDVRRVNWGYEALLDRDGQKSNVRVAEDGRILPQRERPKERPVGPEHRQAGGGRPQRHAPPTGEAPVHTDHPLPEQH